MDKFQYLSSEPEDLLSIEIKGDRIKLVTISTDREEDIFQEFTTEITTYMFPDPARNLEERRAFINGSRQAIAG
jgi:[ribosomal protein S5]-alanine N-acetyltransferase